MGLTDRTALQTLQDAFAAPAGPDVTVHRFFTRWFAAEPAVRAMFPAHLSPLRVAFAQALHWVYGQLVAQRSKEPVAFLAQLGRDHRKYGVTAGHYPAMRAALHAALRDSLAASWTATLEATTAQSLTLITGVMSSAAGSDTGPAWWDGTVVETHRVSRDLAVVRLQLDQPLPYHPGQYVKAEVPQCPRSWRYLSPAIPAQDSGGIEFHVRAVPGGLVSTAIVAETRPGDRWRLSGAHGGLHVDRDRGDDVLMVAGSTGLAPLRALIMDLTRWAQNPRVHLFFGARYPCELYDLPTLWQIAAHNPWLSVSPVTEYSADPPWAAHYPDPTPPRGLHVRQTGRLPEVVAQYGGWGDRQILVCGGPAMVRATVAALRARGAAADRVHHDPLFS